ncbi:MAG: starch-binding protein [Alistipes sp.]|nr:starch-binding protein [Alistipes sp.]
MKKLLSILALALCFVACQNDAVESVSNSDLVDVVLTVDAPEMGITRGLDGDQQVGRSSALGAIDFFNDADWAKYDVRYILEVYAENEDGTGEPIYRERLVNCLDKYAPTTFALRLVPERTYKFVIFADFVADGNHTKVEAADKLAIADWYYDTTDLRNITINCDANGFDAMNEARDAYFITKNVKVSTTGLNEPLTLTRPFAKLRVIATDLDYIAGYAKPGYVEVKYHTEKVYKSFNAVNGKLNAEELTEDERTFKFNVQKDAPYTDGYDKATTNQTLFADYLLAVEGEQTTVNFTMDVYEDDSKTRKIHSHDFNTQIPIQRNHLTTIIGDLLTTQANIDIKIDDNFEDEFVYGWGDDNATTINVWNAGELNADGDYTFVVNGENDFKVTVNGAAVKNQKLTAGDYVLAEDAEEGAELTFTVEELQANETTRALTAVEVIGGTMKVESIENNYKITLDLVLEFSENKDVRHAIYVYEGPISFGKVLDTPKVEAAVEGNVITLTWNAVADATSYTIIGGTEMPVVTEETSYTFTGEYETEYTFTVVAVNDNLASQPFNVTVKTDAAPVVTEAYKLYFDNVADWAKVYAHIWANEGEDLGLESVDWPGRELTETEVLDGDTYYVFQLPATATGKTLNVVFNDGNGTQTKDLAGVVEGNLFFDNYVEPVTPSEVVLYLQPNANWNQANARFAAYFFGNGETWVDMTLVEGETNIYAVTVPNGFESVIFCRMNPGAAANNWDNKWNQTADLEVPTDGTNLYTVTENTWDKGGGVWSVYAPTVVEPEEPTALATPVVTAVAKENTVTLTWEAVENAAAYSITVGTEMPVVTEETSYVFTGEYETEYTFNVVAIPADEEKFAASEAGVATATTEAAPAVEPTYTTVAEFLAADVDNTTFYTLKGTITRVANTNYGNFDLTDETGTIYVYGLYSEDGATNKYWAASGAQLGDDIVISAVRADYNGSAQAGSARFLGLTSPGTLAFWSFEATATSFTAAGGDKEIDLAIYNATAEVVTTSDNAQFSAAYADGVLTITALENTADEAIEGTITVTCGSLNQTIAVSQAAASSGDQTAVEAELVFSEENRTAFSTSQQVFEANNIKVTNDKGSSTSNVADYVAPARFYKNSKVTVTAPGNITTIVFDCNSASYATALQNSGLTGTVSVSSKKVTVILDGSSNEYVISSLTGGQVRMDGVTVTYLQ